MVLMKANSIPNDSMPQKLRNENKHKFCLNSNLLSEVIF